MKQNSGQGDSTNIYYDKVKEQEDEDREKSSWMNKICGKRQSADSGG